MDSVMS